MSEPYLQHLMHHHQHPHHRQVSSGQLLEGQLRQARGERLLRTGSADRAANMLAFAAAALQLLEQALDAAPQP